MDEPLRSDVILERPPFPALVAQANEPSALSLQIKTSSRIAAVRVVSPKEAVPSKRPVIMDEPSLREVMSWP